MKTDAGMTALTWSLLLLLGLIWGGSFFFARIAVHEVPPFTLVFLRLAIAAIALHLYIAGRLDIYRLLRSHWRQFLLLRTWDCRAAIQPRRQNCEPVKWLLIWAAAAAWTYSWRHKKLDRPAKRSAST